MNNTLYNYFRKYKNISFSIEEWNEIDTLLCACISYVGCDNFSYIKDFDTFTKDILEYHDVDDYMAIRLKEIFKILEGSIRYHDLKFKNFINILDENTQFGAITIIYKDKKIISFKGSDKSKISWAENFRLLYEYPTYTQKLAIKYLKKNISIFDKNIIVTGHSKGGNLAMASSMELSDFKYNKIKNVINFDGPGFRSKEYNSYKYKRLSLKLQNILPSNSYVGVLLFNQNYDIILSRAIAVNVHYPHTWKCKGNSLVRGKLTKISNDIHEMTSTNINDIEQYRIKKVFETIFSAFKNKETYNVTLSFTDVIDLINSAKNIDRDTVNYIKKVLIKMLNVKKKDED